MDYEVCVIKYLVVTEGKGKVLEGNNGHRNGILTWGDAHIILG